MTIITWPNRFRQMWQIWRSIKGLRYCQRAIQDVSQGLVPILRDLTELDGTQVTVRQKVPWYPNRKTILEGVIVLVYTVSKISPEIPIKEHPYLTRGPVGRSPRSIILNLWWEETGKPGGTPCDLVGVGTLSTCSQDIQSYLLTMAKYTLCCVLIG